MNAHKAKWSSLEELGLGITGDRVFEALKPFAVERPDEHRYRNEMKLRRKRLAKRLALRTWKGWTRRTGRTIEKIKGEYDKAWSAGLERYDISRGPQSFTPWIWQGEKLLVDAAGSARFRSLMLGAVIAQLKPKSVLEVGCGDGINLALLAGAFPEIVFTGLELTDTGHAKAKALQDEDKLPHHLATYAPLPQQDSVAFKRINFIQGNAADMPFPSASFDLVFTVLAIEQMERIRHKALSEIARVARNYVLNLEPFRDVNEGFWRSWNVASRDYFKGSVAEMPGYGLDPVWATQDFPQEVFLGSALVLSKKRA